MPSLCGSLVTGIKPNAKENGSRLVILYYTKILL
jgi:hypothetical protein